MTHNEQLLQVLACYLHGEPCGEWFSSFAPQDWDAFLHLAWQHMVLPVVCVQVRGLASFGAYPRQAAVYRGALRMAAQQAARTQALLHLLPQLESAGVRYAVLKGLVCRSLYQDPELRISGDEDLFVPAGDKAACLSVLEAAGYRREVPEEDEAWRSPEGMLRLEISFGRLFPQEGAMFDALNRAFAPVEVCRASFEMQGQKVLTFPPTENMLYLLAHALKHFVHSGFGVRQLMDIAAFARAYGKEIDWPRLFARLEEAHGTVFAKSLFALCRDVFRLDVEACGLGPLPSGAPSLLQDILEAGVYGQSSSGRLHSSNVTLHAAARQKHPFLRTLFPPAEVMEKQYPYVRRRIWLPVAWAQRAVRYVGERRRDKKAGHAEGSASIGQRRLELMREYEIL